MIRPITIHCPLCGEVAELFLSVEPSMIVLNCPSCWAPLMYDGEEVSIADFSPVEAPVEALPLHAELQGDTEVQMAEMTQRPCMPAGRPEHPAERTAISQDDLINLRIDLANCRSVEEFISLP